MKTLRELGLSLFPEMTPVVKQPAPLPGAKPKVDLGGKIFVFGSNRTGAHGAGAALDAFYWYGAIWGQEEGMMGESYGIVTKELRRNMMPVELPEVEAGVRRFVEFATAHPELTFCLTPIGCGLAGFTVQQIAPLFFDAPINVLMPREFLPVLKRYGNWNTW